MLMVVAILVISTSTFDVSSLRPPHDTLLVHTLASRQGKTSTPAPTEATLQRETSLF